MFSDTTKANFAFKSILGKAHTSSVREIANESLLSGVTVQASRVWATPVPSLATDAVTAGLVVQVTGLQLQTIVGADIAGTQVSYRAKLAGAVPAGLVGKVNPVTNAVYASGDYIGNIVPEAMGVPGASDYLPVLRNNGVIVAPLDSSDWFLDPFSGIVTREAGGDSTVTWSGPMTLDAYIYIGQSVQEQIGSLGSSLTGSYVTLDTVQTITGAKSFVSTVTLSNITPLVVSSSAMVTNFNADLLDGLHAIDISGAAISYTDAQVLAASGNLMAFIEVVSGNSYAYTDAQVLAASGNLTTHIESVSASVDAHYVHRTGSIDENITGEKSFINNALFAGAVTISGNLYVAGSTTTVASSAMSVADRIITVNAGEPGVGVTNIYAGLEVDRGTGAPYYMVFDELRDAFVIGTPNGPITDAGTLTELQVVATREDNPIDNAIGFWREDGSPSGGRQFVTSTGLTYSASMGLSANSIIYVPANTSNWSTAPDNVFEALDTLASTDANVSTNLANVSAALHTEIVDISSALYALIVNTSGNLHTEMVDVSSSLYTTVYDVSSALALDIATLTSATVDASSTLYTIISDVSSSLYTTVYDVSSSLYTTVYDVSSALYTTVYDVSSSLYTTVYDVSSALALDIDTLTSATVDASSTLYTIISDVSSSLYTTVYDVSSSLYTTVYDVSSSLYTTVYDVSSSLYTTVYDVSSSLYTTITDVSSNLHAYTDSVSASIAANVVAMFDGGTVTCSTIAYHYPITHRPLVSVSDAFPIVSLTVPTSTSVLYVQGITERTTSGFKVILSDVPDVAGFEINWILFKPYFTALP